jgi:hypothetical protein
MSIESQELADKLVNPDIAVIILVNSNLLHKNKYTFSYNFDCTPIRECNCFHRNSSKFIGHYILVVTYESNLFWYLDPAQPGIEVLTASVIAFYMDYCRRTFDQPRRIKLMQVQLWNRRRCNCL